MKSKFPHIVSKNSDCFFILGRTLVTNPWNYKKLAKRENNERNIMQWLKSHTTQEYYKFYRARVTKKGSSELHDMLRCKSHNLYKETFFDLSVWEWCSIYIMAGIRYTF